MATPSTRQAIVQAILKRRTTESIQREKKSMKGYVPSYLEGDEKCVVCGDKATGYHYKCITCEGCKGFFRRTVQKSLENSYQCKHSAKCDINKITRNQCQLCRYNKCISVGMATDLVLDEEKRLAKRKLIEQNRELRRHKELSQMMAQCGWRIERPTDEERRLIHDVTQGYFQANDTQNKTMHEIHNTTDVSERFSVALTAAITNVVDFAKRIPLFVNHISTDDQVLILKVCCMEVITLRCVTSFKHVTKRVTLFPTVDVTKEQLQCTRLEPFCDALFALAEHMHSIDLTPVEIALLQAVIVFTADRPGISERVRLDHAQNTVIRAFEHHLNELWPHDPQYCPSLLIKLNEIRVLSANLSDILMSMRMDEPQELGRLFQATNNINSHSVPLLQVPVHHHHANGVELSKFSQMQQIAGCVPKEIHRTVARSYSQPQLNGYKSTLMFGASDVNSNGVWKTRHLNELLHRNCETILNGARPTQLSYSTSSLRDWVREGKPPQDHQEAENQTRFPSLNGLSGNANNHVVYETFKNCNNKLFQRISRLLPFEQVSPSRNQVLPCTSHKRSQSNGAILPSLVHNDVQQSHKSPNEKTAPTFAKTAVNNFCLQPFQLPSVTTEPSIGFDAKNTSYHEGSSSARNSLITAGILRMGLPMLLPYVTGANTAIMTSTSGINGVATRNETQSLQENQTNAKEIPTSLIPPKQIRKEQHTSRTGNEVHDLTLSDNEDISLPTPVNLTPTKRPISSPTLSQSKLKRVSPSHLSQNGREDGHSAKPNTSKEEFENNVSTKAPTKSRVLKNGFSRNHAKLQATTSIVVQPRPKSF